MSGCSHAVCGGAFVGIPVSAANVGNLKCRCDTGRKLSDVENILCYGNITPGGECDAIMLPIHIGWSANRVADIGAF